MKALSIRQPWAWLVASGYKDIENRRWKTGFRGRVYVHAGRNFEHSALSFRLLREPGILNQQTLSIVNDLVKSWKESAIIGEVDIVDCVSRSDSPWFIGPYGFVLMNPVLYDNPIPCKGKVFFFDPQMAGT
jgi:hypothetical protein